MDGVSPGTVERRRAMLAAPDADIAVFRTHDPVGFVAMSIWDESGSARVLSAMPVTRERGLDWRGSARGVNPPHERQAGAVQFVAKQ